MTKNENGLKEIFKFTILDNEKHFFLIEPIT